MKLDQILETYDEAYADEYDDTFLANTEVRPSVAFQLAALKQNLEGSKSWLDVACGTGFFLKMFPDIETRHGLDISPAMLGKARTRNRNVGFTHGNYLDSFPEWENEWDLVSCMWWAYCLVESIAQLKHLVSNLARWTSHRGTCFVPLCNPRKFNTKDIVLPYLDSNMPGVKITGISWTWAQQNGKRHDDMISPQVEYMVEMFEQFFTEVTVVEGPLALIGEGYRPQDILIARGKKQSSVGA